MPQISSWYAGRKHLLPVSYSVQGLAPGASPGYRVEWRDAAGKFVASKLFASRQAANQEAKALIAEAREFVKNSSR